MASTPHTYGPTCSLHTESNPFTRRASVISEEPPKIRAQFFYGSNLPIDDPLLPIPPPSNGSTGPSEVPPQPFSVYDNAALESAWRDFMKADEAEQSRRRCGQERQPSSEQNQANSIRKGDNDDQRNDGFHTLARSPKDRNFGIDNLAHIFKGVREKNAERTEREKSKMPDPGSIPSSPPAAPGTAEGEHSSAQPHLMLCDDPDHIPFDYLMPVASEEVGSEEFESGRRKRKHRSPFHRKDKDEKNSDKEDAQIPLRRRFRSHSASSPRHGQPGPSTVERDTTGTPFLRAPNRERRSRERRNRSQSEITEPELDQTDGMGAGDTRSHMSSHVDTQGTHFGATGWGGMGLDGGAEALLFFGNTGGSSASRRHRPTPYSNFSSSQASDSESPSRPLTSQLRGSAVQKHEEHKETRKTCVLVGISRLHLVEIPVLQMKPIYWIPMNDISSVTRGTWFYRDTMYPVESDVANQLEEGYEYMRPWTQTYLDEINSCLQVGPVAELKLVYKLWPFEAPNSSDGRPITSKSNNTLLETGSEQLTSEEVLLKRAVVGSASAENRAAGALGFTDDKNGHARLYARSSVIYADAKDAQILNTGQLPSASVGRRPLGAIRRGKAVGIPVVRGFDRKVWDKLHPVTSASVAKARRVSSITQSDTARLTVDQKPCEACSAAEQKPKMTDLVLVIHGIGQKLSERVESFHFTHAINNFRRQVNIELEADVIQPWLRQDLGGVMVLPINWRSTLHLDDDDAEPTASQTEHGSSNNQFTLKDITAETLPAVRNLISDVMLDIPYYLSHHKTIMIKAVIKEANRIYRLWCANNPGFHETGRVHLIAHSLGSVMALDILSKQPTKLPPQVHLQRKRVHDDIFEFDTKSLFFCGSPAGFFLLLNRASLLPRRGRDKLGVDAEDPDSRVAGEAGTYGCLAVDNVYNIMHYNDPIAYRVNACVDVDYAASLQPAVVPSATGSWMSSITSVFRTKTIPSTNSAAMKSSEALPARPSVSKLPSQVEMEVHDFPREEIAEKRMYLLNDNGQIDYYLSSGGGPLEIQYINMLSAHSSYWTLQDFVRFVVVEVGRKGGRGETVGSMRAVKKAWVRV